MEQKFISFEAAIEKLGISSDRLNELRERGALRAYRDGASWKFRSEEIEAMVQGGIPEPPPPSDIGLIRDEDLVKAVPLETDEEDLELDLVDESSSDLPAEAKLVQYRTTYQRQRYNQCQTKPE